MNTRADELAVSDEPSRGLIALAERGRIPDPLLRLGIRQMCARRLREELAGGVEAQAGRFAERIQALRHSAIAVHTDAANRQHYELPAAFFQHCLGARLKYSCAFYPTGRESLDEAEAHMLALYCERAQLADGQHILELGCGWGSLTLWMAERFPNARITAVSNSHGQRAYILDQCCRRGLDNVTIITGDVSDVTLPAGTFDRCVSVEMFEHVRNYQRLMQRIRQWLRDDGKLFVHIFAHRTLMYPYETEGQGNWMGRHFFTGGQMPAVDTLLHFQDHLRLAQRWLVDGRHYQRTANHWLANQDAQREPVMAALRDTYGADAAVWWQRWRMFWMACAELFGYRNGQEWVVAHYLFDARDAGAGS